MAVDRESSYIFYVYSFVSCWSPLGVFGTHFAVLGLSLAFRWLPWDAGGRIWDSLGPQVELGLTLGQKWNVRFRYYLERLRCLRIKSDLGDLSRGSAVSSQSEARAAAPNPTRAGEDDVSLEQTPSNHYLLT